MNANGLVTLTPPVGVISYANLGRGAFSFERGVAPGYTLTLHGSNIRRERTGVHARIAVLANGRLLASHQFNVEDGKDRNWLAGQAYKPHLEGIDGYGKPELQHELDLFCEGLWAQLVGELRPAQVGGLPEPIPPDFLVDPYLIREAGTILLAPPGRGKSFVTMLLAVSLDAGVSTLFPVRQQTPILFINLERGEQQVRNRLGMVNRALGLPPTRPLHMLNKRGRSLADIVAPVETYLLEHPEIGAIFLDSLSRSGLGNLVDDAVANRAMDILSSLHQTWFTIAHTPRADDSHTFGSVMFDAAADLCVQLLSESSPDGTLGVGLQLVKDNDTGKRPLSIMALEFGIGLTGARRAHQGEFPEIEAERKTTLKQVVTDYLLHLPGGKASAVDIAKALGRSRTNISEMLKNDPAFQFVSAVGKEKLYAVKGQPVA